MPTAGPALERKGDVASLPDRARAAQRLLRRRDPPPAARARGDLLSRDGGPQAADHGRPGRRRARRHARPARVHADRRHHPHRPAHHAAARPLRRHPPARAVRRRRSSAGSCAARRASSRSRSTTRAPRRSPRARAARRGWPTGCSSACATSPRCAAPARSTRAWRARRSTCSRSTRPGLDRLDRDILRNDLREVRRRPGRAVDAGGRGRGGAGHDRGRLRALPAPAGLSDAHAARARGHRRRVRPPGARSAPRRPQQPVLSARQLRRAALASMSVRMPIFICPNCGDRSISTERTAGFQDRARALQEVRLRLPVRAARRLLPGAQRRLLPARPAGPPDRHRPRRARAHRAGRPRRDRPAGAGRARLEFENGDDHIGTALEWGVRVLDKPVTVHAEGDRAGAGEGGHLPRLRRRRGPPARPDAAMTSRTRNLTILGVVAAAARAGAAGDPARHRRCRRTPSSASTSRAASSSSTRASRRRRCPRSRRRRSTTRSRRCASAPTRSASPSPRSSAPARARSRSACPTCRTPSARSEQVGTTAQLQFYDWEPNVLDRPRGVRGQPRRSSRRSRPRRSRRARPRQTDVPPAPTLHARAGGPARNNTAKDRYYLFGPDERPIGPDKQPLRTGRLRAARAPARTCSSDYDARSPGPAPKYAKDTECLPAARGARLGRPAGRHRA